jgi:hypothetical protein
VIVSSPTFGGTGCLGNGPTNSHVVAEYIFQEGGGTTTINSGTDGESGDAVLIYGAAFSTNVPSSNAACGWSASFPSSGSGSLTPAVETSASYDPLAGATNFTLMAWVKRESVSSTNNTAARIVSDTSSTALTNTTAGFEFRFSGASGTLALRVNGNEVSTSVGGIAPNSNTWHHVAVVYDGTRPATNTLSRNVHFYVDGVQRGDGNTLTNVVVGSNTNKLTIGNSAVSRGVGNLLVGKLDDVRVLRGYAPAAVGDGKTNTTITCFMNSKDDFEPPTISCPTNITVSTNPGQCVATGVNLGAPVTSDNCGVASVTNNAPAQFPVGTTVVTWTVTDAVGNHTSCQQTVTVIDTEPPSISCPVDVTVNTTGGGCGASNVSLGQPTVADNCPGVSVANNAPATFPVGTTVVTWTATDASGNHNTCQQFVTVANQVPTISCQSNVTVNADAGNCYASGVNLGQPTISGNCGIASLTNNAPATFPVGTTTVTWTVVDANGSSNSCQQTVTVLDNQSPTISCPANVTVNADAGQCSASSVNLGQPVVSENCPGASVTNDAPATFPVGATTVTWTVTDAHGGSATCQQTVTVVDATKLDSDGDGMPDCWELSNELDPNDPANANMDADGDGYTNYEEYWMGTDPQQGPDPLSPGDPVTIHVDASYTGAVENGGVDAPYKRIQSAIDAASSNQITAIWVRPGIYNERPYCTGKANIHFFSDAGASATIIDGQHVNSSVVRIYDFTRATFRGFTIRNASTDWLGAGLRIEATNGVILVANNIITGNVTTNTSSSGGGGGIYLKTADGSRLVNNFITKNSARRGGGVLFAAGKPQFWHNTVADNAATDGKGGGISALLGIRPDIRNNIVWGNAGTGTVAQVHSSGLLFITNNVVQGGATGFNNIDADPKFISPVLNNYHIRVDSSARDAAVNLPLTWDADNEFRPEGAAKEIGADEFVDTDGDGLPDSWQSRYGTVDPSADNDNDGLTNLQEYQAGTDPTNPDSDGDGTIDGCDANPLVADTNTSNASNNGPICAGDTLQLHAAGVIGGSFSWTGPNGFTSTEQDPQITNAQPSASGAYYVTETAEGQSPVQSCTAVTVTAFPSAGITAPATVCPGFAGIVASVPDAGPGATYNWSISNGTIQSGQGTSSIRWKAGYGGSVQLGVTVTSRIGCSSSGLRDVAVQCPADALGLRGDYYDGREFNRLVFTRLDRAIDFNWGFLSPGPGIGKDDFSVRWTGQFTPQFSETYTFYTLSDDGVRVWINDQLVIDDWIKPSDSGHSGTLALTAGQKYNIKVAYYETFTRAYAKLWWWSASQPKELVPFNLPLPLDSDNDGLADDEEQLYGTDPLSTDTDGDGITDYEEIKLAFTNPLAADFDGTVTDVAVKNGYEISGSLGQWETNSTDIVAFDRRGYVEYSMTAPSADVYRIEVEGREQVSYQTEPSQFDLQLYVDGEYLGRQTLEATTTAYGKIHLYTPYLQPGSHTVRIFWDNAASYTSLRIRAVRFQRLGGPDANNNGVKDWVETRLRAMSGIEPGFPITSYVSPAFIEGRGRFLSMMSITTDGGVGVAPQHGPGHRWYANVPIDSVNHESQITISHQNGGLVEAGAVRWVTKNILDGGTLTIRKGDSLLLTAAPDGATSGTVAITIASTQYSTTPSQPVAHTFDTTGTFTVNGTFNNGTPQSGSLTVNVLDHTFTTEPACGISQTRRWDNFSVPADIVFDADPRFLKFAQIGTLTNDGRRVSLLIDQNEPRYVVSRIGASGPILASARAAGFQLFSAAETGLYVIETYEDGSELAETVIVLSPVLPDITIQIQIIMGGITFDDGTVYKELTAADFDELGQAKVRFLSSSQAITANCHTLAVVQGGAFVGNF